MPFASAYIVIHGPGHEGTRLMLREGITSFGRLPSNDVILLGDLVSRHHARIIFFDGKASVQDLGSHNGSWVNSEKVTTRVLAPGDVIRIGNFKIAVREGHIDDMTDQATMTGVVDSPSPPARPPPPPEPSEASAEIRGSEPPPLPGNVATREPNTSGISKELDDAAAGTGRPGVSNTGTLQLLYRVTEALSRTSNATDFLQHVLAYLLERIRAQAGVVFRVLPGQEEPVVVTSYPPDAEPQVSKTVVRWTVTKNFTVFSKDVRQDVRFAHGHSVAMLAEDRRGLVSAPISIEGKVYGAVYLARDVDEPFVEAEVDAIESIGHLAAVGIERLEMREQLVEDRVVREALARFHSPDVVDRIVAAARGGPLPALEQTTATVCVFDVPGFTAMIDQLPVEDVSLFMNDFMESMCAIVFAHRGTINKSIGEGIVSVFGAPFSHGNDAARAVAAALNMRDSFDRLVAERPSLSHLRLRAGVATGTVLAGPIGSPRRMEYSVLGESVDRAARTAQAGRPGMILITDATYRAVAQHFLTRKVSKDGAKLGFYEVLGRAVAPRGSTRTA